MANGLRELVVVLTGASSGVGRASVRAFAARGARLTLVARNAEALEPQSWRCAALAAQRSSAPPTRSARLPHRRF